VNRRFRIAALTKGIHKAANITSRCQGETLPDIATVRPRETRKENPVQKRKKT
jgi:hypothetical protein